MDPRSRSSRGFAFVNLTSVESAHQFYRTLQAVGCAVGCTACPVSFTPLGYLVAE